MSSKFLLVECPCVKKVDFPLALDLSEQNDDSEEKDNFDIIIDCPSCGDSLELSIKGGIAENDVFLSKKQ
ncbi:MAG: hypothetical protein Sapg2KO_50280 [Saprospiraceae bacterium]